MKENKPEDKKENKINLTVIVNGKPAEVNANSNAPLQTAVLEALRETGNAGQPPENWHLRDADGNLLDLNKKISEYSFTTASKLFLSLKAGVGG